MFFALKKGVIVARCYTLDHELADPETRGEKTELTLDLQWHLDADDALMVTCNATTPSNPLPIRTRQTRRVEFP
jgi:hypothetical protein